MQEFDKTKCLNNIYCLARQKEIKIGDLERQAGVSIGYMSRLNKEGNNANPGLEFLISAANILNVSLDSLCFSDFRAVAATEGYVLSFLDWLLEGTYVNKLPWQKRLDSEYYDCCMSDVASLSKEIVGEELYELARASVEQKLPIVGPWFTLKTKDKNDPTPIYLLRCAAANNTEGDPAKDVYRLLLIQDYRQKCLAASETALFHPKLIRLYDAADHFCMHPVLDSGIKEVIDAFMNESSGTGDSFKKF